jgi:hypothetical protein
MVQELISEQEFTAEQHKKALEAAKTLTDKVAHAHARIAADGSHAQPRASSCSSTSGRLTRGAT